MQKIIQKISEIPYIKNHLILRQFLKFAIVGFINTGLDFLVYFLLTRLWDFWMVHYLWANLISFSVAITNSYILNRNWTFRHKGGGVALQYIKYFLVTLIGLCFNEGILFLFVQVFHFYDLLAKVFAVSVVMLWNFGVYKFWIFREKKS